MNENFGCVIFVSLGFTFLFTAFNTAQWLSTKALKDNGFENLGFYSLGVIYATFGIFSFFSSPVVKRLGSKYSMMLGASCYAVYMGSFILPLMRSENPQNDTL